MDTELLLKCIGYFPDYLSVLSRTLFTLLLDSLSRNSCIIMDNSMEKRHCHMMSASSTVRDMCKYKKAVVSV